MPPYLVLFKKSFFLNLVLGALGLCCSTQPTSGVVHGLFIAMASLVWEVQGCTGLVALVHGLSCPEARGIFSEQVVNRCPLLHWRVNSLDHHGRPALCPFPSSSPSPALLLLPTSSSSVLRPCSPGQPNPNNKFPHVKKKKTKHLKLSYKILHLAPGLLSNPTGMEVKGLCQLGSPETKVRGQREQRYSRGKHGDPGAAGWAAQAPSSGSAEQKGHHRLGGDER